MSARKPALVFPATLLLSLCLLLAWQSSTLAHGVALKIDRGDAVVVTGEYSDGEAMSFVKVKVLNPMGKTHQVGNTDATGRFAFVADQPGKWLATLEDGMGHKGEIVWRQGQVKAAQDAAPSPAQPTDQPKWVRAAWGLSALFWLWGMVFWWKGARKTRRMS